MIQAAKRGWTRANIVLGALPFISFLLGTYLTRSGVYADLSVHSFAQMNQSALKILLAVMCFAIVGFLAILAFRWRSPAMVDTSKPSKGLNRKDGQAAGVLVLGAIGFAVAFGTAVPLVEILQGRPAKIVEEPLYHQVLGWFFPVLLVLMAIVPFLTWSGPGPAVKQWWRLATAFCFAFMFTGISVFLLRNSPWRTGQETVAFPFVGRIPTLPWIGFLLFLCFFVICANGARMLELRRGLKLGWGGLIAHVGIAVFMAGMLVSRGFERKQQIEVQRGDSVATQLGYTIEFKDFTKKDPFDRDNQAEFTMQGANPRDQITAQPGLYLYDNGSGDPVWMKWPYIKHFVSHDIYFSLGDPQTDVWQNAVQILPGKSYEESHVKVDYLRFRMDGAPGKAGTRFVAVVRVTSPSGVYQAEPYVEIGPDGVIQHVVPINDDLMISMQAINANDQSALLQVHFTKPIFPIELFYKPMTSLVWLGAGILAIGVAMSALYRRNNLAPQKAAQPTLIPTPRTDDAIVPAAQM
jgi:cytochrome c-type biogenesis protein CcmF